MFNLTNITVKEFFLLSEEESLNYLNLQSIMNSKSIFMNRRAKYFGKLQFGQVAELKQFIQNPTFENLFESFKIVYGVNKLQYLNADVISFLYALNHIRESLKIIVEKEKSLVSEPDPLMISAGVKSLSRFGDMAVLIILGKQFSKSTKEIQTWTYDNVFAILLWNKLHGEVQKEYMRLKTPKKAS